MRCGCLQAVHGVDRHPCSLATRLAAQYCSSQPCRLGNAAVAFARNMPAPGEQRWARSAVLQQCKRAWRGSLSKALQCCAGRASWSAPERLQARRRGPAVCRPTAAHVGSLVAGGLRFGVVVARFNDLVTKPLLEGVLEGFERHGVPREEVEVWTHAERCAVRLVLVYCSPLSTLLPCWSCGEFIIGHRTLLSKSSCWVLHRGCLVTLTLLQVAWVPGSFELPVVAKSMARSGRFDAVVTVGAVVGPQEGTLLASGSCELCCL